MSGYDNDSCPNANMHQEGISRIRTGSNKNSDSRGYHFLKVGDKDSKKMHVITTGQTQLYINGIKSCLQKSSNIYFYDSKLDYTKLKSGDILEMSDDGKTEFLVVNKKSKGILKCLTKEGNKTDLDFTKNGTNAEPIEINNNLETTLKNLIKN